MLERRAEVAGMLIGLGVIINTLAANPILGAFLFSFGLLTIIQLGIPLYTGQIGFFFQKRKTDLLKILIFNIIGICFIILFKMGDKQFTSLLIEKSLLKFEKPFIRMFWDGFLCGILIHFAVKCKKELLTIMAVMIFILMGAEHCIADFPYLMCVPTLTNFIKFFIIVMGNSLGAIFLEAVLKQKGK